MGIKDVVSGGMSGSGTGYTNKYNILERTVGNGIKDWEDVSDSNDDLDIIDREGRVDEAKAGSCLRRAMEY